MVFSNTTFLQQSKKSINFNFKSTITSAETKIPVTQTKLPLKDGALFGSADRDEVDLDSDVNQLASGNLCQ